MVVDPVDGESVRRGKIVLDDDGALASLVYRRSARQIGPGSRSDVETPSFGIHSLLRHNQLVFSLRGLCKLPHLPRAHTPALPLIIFALENRLLIDLVLGDVAPEDHSRPEDEVERGRGIGVVDYRGHFVVVEGDFPDVVLPREQQRGVALHRLAPGVVPRVFEISLDAFALEAALLVNAELRASPGLLALVHV